MKQLIIIIIILLIILLIFFLQQNKEKYNWKKLEFEKSNELWNNLICNTYVINLEKDKGRKKHMENILNSLNVKYKFWKGYDARARGIHNYCVPVFKENSLGEIGCAISHTKLIEKIANKCDKNRTLLNKWFLIFEDDIIPNIKDYKKLKSMVVNSLLNVPENYDIILLGSCFDQYKNNAKPINEYMWNIDSLCMHSYAVKGRVAREMSNTFMKYMCNKPVDVILRDSMKNKSLTVFKKKYNRSKPAGQFDMYCKNDYFCHGLFGQRKNSDSFKTNILKNSVFKEERNKGFNDVFGEY